MNIPLVYCTNGFSRNAGYLITTHAIFLINAPLLSCIWTTFASFQRSKPPCRASSNSLWRFKMPILIRTSRDVLVWSNCSCLSRTHCIWSRTIGWQEEIVAIAQMAAPRSKQELLSFLVLAGYYRRFKCDFATHALPLSRLTEKDTSWHWGSDPKKAFLGLKLTVY